MAYNLQKLDCEEKGIGGLDWEAKYVQYVNKKNAYGRHYISQRVQSVTQIQKNCHMLYVTCHVSSVTCSMSPDTTVRFSLS